MLYNVNSSKRKVISFIAIAVILLAIPFTVVLLQQTQTIRQRALQPTAWCTPSDGSIPGGYSYIPGALEIYVHVIEPNEAIGPIPGVYLRADKIDNNPGTGVNTPINFSDGDGCGFSAEGITDIGGHMNLEPLNCAHNNFRVSHGDRPSGLPPDVVFDSQRSEFQPDGNDPYFFTPDISNLALGNGYAGILKLYYRRIASVPPISTPTTAPPLSTPTRTPTPTIPPPATACPVPNVVTNVRIDCPYPSCP